MAVPEERAGLMGMSTKANGYWNGGRPALAREHGTVRGYAQHRYRKEPVCLACRAAERERGKARRDDGGAGDEGERELDSAPAVDGTAAASA